MLARALEIASILLVMLGIAIYAVFRDKTIDEARGILSVAFIAVVSWPVRYFTYRSGHGRHAVGELAAS
jgi:hypothetical protein